MKTSFYPLFILLLILAFSKSAHSQAAIDLETGAVFTGYNDVRIPGDAGTFFSLKDDLNPETAFFYRLRLSYTLNARHTLSLLYAPLEVKSEGSVPEDIFFTGVEFPAHTELDASFKFNSYRITYRYEIVRKPGLEFGLGFTAKLRDAKIALSSPGLSAEKPNVGFVPIINFRLFWKLYENLGLLLYGDALAAPQGRAEDVLLAATLDLSERFRIRAGYRILEGGADNDEVYTFSLFNYASVGITYMLITE
ncbi:MAG: hypothetical protein ACLFPE_04010 [Bacteroidales bacterium]